MARVNWPQAVVLAVSIVSGTVLTALGHGELGAALIGAGLPTGVGLRR